MPKGILVGYRLAEGKNICFICAHKPEQEELMRSTRNERETMFRSDYNENKCPKCIICKTRMVDVDLSSLHKGTTVDDDDEDGTPKKPAKSTSSKTSTPKTTSSKRRGRPPKAKVELYYNDDPLTEPGSGVGVVPKRGRGRPKGSKNKPKAHA